MPGFFSWISGLFASKPAKPLAKETRLFNPAGHRQEANADTSHQLARQLEEHLFCWLLDAEPSDIRKDSSTATAILDELLNRLNNRHMEELPRQPLSLPMLMRALSDETTDRQELTDIILRDPALTDQLLQIANSPYFRTSEHTIESVDQAVFMLGINGIRNVISAAIMRPMMAARNSREALFAQRVWRWGLTCARSSEQIGRLQGADSSSLFMVGLLPALSYIIVYRELQRISKVLPDGTPPGPALIHHAMARYHWTVCQLLANEWSLPPKFHASLMAAERPVPGMQHTPLADGMVIGTREVLRHARQRNLSDEDLARIVQLPPSQIEQIHGIIKTMLQNNSQSSSA
ncbi:HDOD domain-containing protein [Marinobacter salinexigens]|uniref:HDOD domain-containing protein n=1 Tax=Marinobacter salinexigens TaxID=2919747 RepID=A0A5B0VPW6_9GAMM|nr:HDOD domain-containing protein [Marinobacter salinexigens]KAA1176001.1 HDOD domain-containing protein [Marinobacter salinexigens]